MQEVSRLLSIKQLTTTPYHPICNGLVETFNGTLKRMLRRLCSEQPRKWHPFINPLLFAYREVPQESTGLSPFEMLYERTVRGPMSILKEMWTNETDVAEVKTSYDYVIELKERLKGTMKLAQEELEKSQGRYKKYYDRKSKKRNFQVGNKILIMLPTDQNKLLMQWKGPFEIIKKVGENDYQVQIRNKAKTYHINMLKLYHDREEPQVKGSNQSARKNGKHSAEGETVAASARAQKRSEEECMVETSVDEDELLELGRLTQEEDISDVELSKELSKEQQEDIRKMLKRRKELFTDLPGRAGVIRHSLTLTDDKPIRSKPYPLPYAKRANLKEEIDKMLKAEIIRESNSPYASPIVIVSKKDGTDRICVDYRKLNRVTVADPEPMRTAEDLF